MYTTGVTRMPPAAVMQRPRSHRRHLRGHPGRAWACAHASASDLRVGLGQPRGRPAGKLSTVTVLRPQWQWKCRAARPRLGAGVRPGRFAAASGRPRVPESPTPSRRVAESGLWRPPRRPCHWHADDAVAAAAGRFIRVAGRRPGHCHRAPLARAALKRETCGGPGPPNDPMGLRLLIRESIDHDIANSYAVHTRPRCIRPVTTAVCMQSLSAHASHRSAQSACRECSDTSCRRWAGCAHGSRAVTVPVSQSH